MYCYWLLILNHDQLEFGISEWTTGCYVDTTFYELDWRKVYFDHLLDLKDFDEATTGVKLYERIAKKLLSNGRYVHAVFVLSLFRRQKLIINMLEFMPALAPFLARGLSAGYQPGS